VIEHVRTLNTPNVLQSMMTLEQSKARAKTAKEKDTTEKAVEELTCHLPRTDDDTGDAHDLLAEFDYCDLSDHRREGTRVQTRHNVEVGSLDNQQNPPTVNNGFLHHTRLGLVGWISYWCCGDAALAVVILVVLINTFGLTEIVSDTLGNRKQKEVETNTKIVDLLKHALDETKNCRNEQQRVEFHIALVCVMPARETPYVSDQSVDIRAQFNKDVELLQQPLKVADRVLSDGDLCELTKIGDDVIGQDPHVGTACVVMFRAGETTQEHRYSTMFGNAKGSARL
jgi:hypothetical protein